MKQLIRKVTAAGLVLSLTIGQAALASEAMGHDLHAGTTALSEGAELTTRYFWSDTYSDLRTERYVTYTPNQSVQPTVSFGESILKRSTLTNMARTLESSGKRVVGGTNGDFYVLSTGQPLGMVVTDGYLRSSSSYHYAIGFRSDGTAFIGKPELTITADLPSGRMIVSGGINKVRKVLDSTGSGGLLLLTEDFAATTNNTSPGVDVFLVPITEGVGETVPAGENGSGQDLVLSDYPKIGGRVRCAVTSVSESQGAGAIPKGGFVLTMNGKDDAAKLDQLRALQPGDEVDINVTSADTRWNDAVEALGGMYRLLENGRVGSGLSAEQTARTAIGIKPDGSVIFYTMDGKQDKLSVGASCTQIAKRLAELGCTEAIGLDGGGSTTLGVTYPDQDSMEVVNSPSDGSQRSVSNAIFLTTDLKATGEPASLSLKPGDALLLSGTELSYSANVLDSAWYDMGTASDVTYTAQGAGTITETGVFTAGPSAGSATVTGVSGTGLTGASSVTVVATPDTISLFDEKTGAQVKGISIEPEGQLSLRAASTWRNLALQSQDTCYTWACDASVGTVTSDGTFTAGAEGASGSLTVTAGGRTLTIPVNVAGHVQTLEDMEGENLPFTSTGTASGTAETSLNYIRTGSRSLRLDYDAGAGGTAELTAGCAIPGGEKYLGVWVYGDGSANSLTAVFTDGAGKESVVPVTGLGFTGWKHVLIALPAGAEKLSALRVVYGGGERRDGTIWLDQLTTANAAIEDFNAPSVSLKISGNQVTAAVSDNVDQTLPASAVKLYYDGVQRTFTWNESTGTLTASLPAGSGSHRVTVTAADASGNLGRATEKTGQGETMIFADMEDHWAAEYANYLYEQGITKGVSAGETRLYQPDAQITRAEFFTMAARWMGLDLTQYDDVELPFADAGEIPDWALSAVKAMYARGIVQGSLNNGTLYGNTGSTITRAEAMTILGRTQSRGWPETDLSRFSDGSAVPSWAAAYVRSLVGQGAVNGYQDGTLRPGEAMTRAQVAKVLDTLR